MRTKTAIIITAFLTLALSARAQAPAQRGSEAVVAGKRDPAFWPFASTSPWNMPIGDGAKFAEVDSPGYSVKAGAGIVTTEWSHPIWIASPSDPMRKIYDKNTGRVFAEIRIPANARPDPKGDGHFHIIDETHAFVIETYAAKLRPDGDWESNNVRKNDLRGEGVYVSGPVRYTGTRAYGGSAIGGLIRKGELQNGIPHALAVAVPRPAMNQNTPSGPGKPCVWPASTADNGWQITYGKIGNIHMGTLQAIAGSVDVSKLGLSPGGLVLARAMQDYGVYITEANCPTCKITFYAEPTADAEVTAAVRADLSKLIQHLKIVTNNTSETRGGGGKPRRALAPPPDR